MKEIGSKEWFCCEILCLSKGLSRKKDEKIVLGIVKFRIHKILLEQQV